MRTCYTILFTLLSIQLFSQQQISGRVTDHDGNPLPGVNIFVEDTYDGTSSNEEGNFEFATSESGTKTLSASFIGYQKWTNTIDTKNATNINIELKESVNTLDAVTITAGIFAAADQKRASVLDPLDIYTTASANGDIMAAIKTMPGTQASADDGRLMVRGGDAYESKTYIDGLVAAQPYYSKTPDVATRGRFSPSLFAGVQFNSGGYSAEYGQALSSVLELNSTDVANADVTGVSIMTIGAEANITRAFKNSSLMASGAYMNMAPYHAIFPSTLNWTKPVESVGLNVAHRYKPSSGKLLKSYVYADFGDLAYKGKETNNSEFTIASKNSSLYANCSFRNCLSDENCYNAGISTSFESNSLNINGTPVNTCEISADGRFKFFHQFNEGINLNMGANETFSQYTQEVYSTENKKLNGVDLNDHTLGIYAESEIRFSKNIAIKPGLRAEYGTLLKKTSLSPRFAVALKTGKNSQISGAWGMYCQNPEFDYLKFNPNLELEEATHYILSYQTGNIEKQLFRAEAYYKTYNKLITWDGNNEYYPKNIANNGNGYARGIDLFWRDKKSIKNVEYWITYSFIDTKRQYENFPTMATPDFISAHNFSMVSKYWINSISTQVGFSFTASSGKNFDDTSTPEFMDIHTGWYNDLSLNMSKIFFLGNQYSVLYVSLTNVLGSDPILAYRPTSAADSNGNYQLTPVKQDSKRFLFIGLFLNFD